MAQTTSGTVAFRPGKRLVLNVQGGTTEVVGREGTSDVTFEAEGGTVEAVGRGGYSQLQTTRIRSLRVEVPREAEIRFDGQSGLRIRSIKGAVHAECSSGEVRCEDVEGNVHVDAGAGDVMLRGIAGSVHLDSAAGAVEGSQLGGTVRIDAGAGAVRLRDLGKAPVRIDSSAGMVELTFSTPPSGMVRVEAGSGPVVLEVPEDSALTANLAGHPVDVTEAKGFVASHTSRTRVRGQMNGGGVAFNIESSGPVRLLTKAANASLRQGGDAASATGASADDPVQLELQVLQMLAEGKVNTAEADALLAALHGEPDDRESAAAVVSDSGGDAPEPTEPDASGTADETDAAGAAGDAEAEADAQGTKGSETHG